jgi:hypothetical protein
VLVFRGVAKNGNNVGVFHVDSFAEESEFVFESVLSVDNDVLNKVGLMSSSVTDDFHITVVSIMSLGLDNFNVRVEVRRGGGRLLVSGR